MKKSTTTTKLGNGLYRETRRSGNHGVSQVYRPGFILRDVKSTTRW
jgi:hypothetical protein